MIPTYDEFLSSAAKWGGKHKGVAYELSWHGKSDYSPKGTWCWYIMVTQEQFSAEDWKKLRLERQDKQLFSENWHRHWSYETFPDLDAHGGWTWGEQTVYLGKDGREYEHVKVGCDYAHLWDRERCFPEGLSDVERDVKHSIDLLIELFPKRKLCCGYSGRWDDAEWFYTAKNGALVHKSQQDKLREEPGWWEHWKPADAA